MNPFLIFDKNLHEIKFTSHDDSVSFEKFVAINPEFSSLTIAIFKLVGFFPTVNKNIVKTRMGRMVEKSTPLYVCDFRAMKQDQNKE